MELDAGLRALGYDDFRPGQREAISALLEVGRLLLVAPTGGGKSLIYQLPGSLLPGTTLVVSPLVALMHDQVAALSARGVPSTYLAATLEPDEMRRRLSGLAHGEYKLVYVAPERLAFEGFRAMLSRLMCPLVAIDEAHCITDWGHDFRPDYLRIRDLLQALPRARVIACTATATPIVRDEILRQLGLPEDTPQIVRGFARPELRLRAAEVSGAAEKRGLVDALLAEAIGGGPGAVILYAPTRRGAEAEHGRLAASGWRAACYHAGMPGADREDVSRRFASGDLQVVVATNAFGMGIDRADVRAVIHLGPPGSIEAYYQEVGRAGRDGNPAWGLLLTSAQDLPLRRRLLEMPADERAPDPEVVEHKWGLFLELMRWVEGGSCRHDAILRYFDTQEVLGAHGCGHCDVCESLAEPADEADVTLIVRKALSGIARVHGRFGLNLAAKLLKGADDERLGWSGLTQVTTFGALADRAEEWIVRLLRRCVTAGWVDFTGGERPIVVLTDTGREVMHGRRPARLLLPPATTRRRRAERTPAAGAPAAPDFFEMGLFEALRAHRLEVARTHGVPAYMVASDRALRDMARLRPKTLAELQLANGIGPAKAKRYGDGFLAVIRG
ncbi:MAG TPA: ATP-dependent DNA helicase RecQ [Planctomycetota bacterium]|nr:ATP-dependent DNA helicase RecQ [Planctomycetota bacterium]